MRTVCISRLSGPTSASSAAVTPDVLMLPRTGLERFSMMEPMTLSALGEMEEKFLLNSNLFPLTALGPSLLLDTVLRAQ